jgi:peptidoglycan/LPS O-acetylase OafA/YrhL
VTAGAWRADIDGLRALAVASVIAFHAGVAGVSGGYVGVDVFFVISGYLIAGNIYAGVERGQFTLAGFYERRIRRIQPALIAMVAVSAVVFAAFLTPVDYKSFAQSVGASLTFCSNLFFYFKSGYFDVGSETKPLLHTWSLAVEEQYYLAFPLLVVALHRVLPRRTTLAIASLAALSFVVSVLQVRAHPDAAFYLPFARAWELLAGAWLARGALPAPRSAWQRQACGLAGLLAIVGPVILYTPATRFPGESALLPCVGALLVIHAGCGGKSLAGALLSSAPATFIGRISYSLYLWHWPLLVAARYLLFRELAGPLELGLYAAAVVALAWASWRWVEQPFRTRGAGPLPTRARVFGATAAVTGAGMAFALAVHVGQGFPARFAQPARGFAAAALDTNPQRLRCDRLPPERIAAGQACTLGASEHYAPSFVLIGDSFGDAAAPGIDESARALGLKGLSLTYSGCFLLLGARQDNPACARFMDAAVAYVGAHPSVRNVVLVGRWTSALLGDRFGQVRTQGWYVQDAQSTERSQGENRRVFERSFDRLLTAFDGRRVAVVAYIPEQRYDVPRALALSATFGYPAQPALPVAMHEQRQVELRDTFDRLQARHPFDVIDVGRALCGAMVCDVLRQGVALYADDNHLSAHGAEALAGVWSAALGAPGGRGAAGIAAAAQAVSNPSVPQ